MPAMTYRSMAEAGPSEISISEPRDVPARARLWSKRCRAIAVFLLPMGLSIAVFTGAACAQEQPCIDEIRAQLVPAAQRAVGRDDGTGIAAEACKPWPYDPKLTLAVVAYTLGDSDPDVGERTLRQVVAILGADGRVVARRSDDIGEDAVVAYSENSLRLDTARYDLAPGVRAFGVRFASAARGASCPDRHFEDELTLYVRDGKALRPVFATYLGVHSALEGGLCVSMPDKAIVEHATITLSMGPGRSRGYADIVSTASVERWDGADREPRFDRRVQRTFRYDARRYNADAYDAALYWEAQRDPR
jgi:hypothetical protein